MKYLLEDINGVWGIKDYNQNVKICVLFGSVWFGKHFTWSFHGQWVVAIVCTNLHFHTFPIMEAKDRGGDIW